MTITTELAQRIAAIAELKSGYKLGHADVAILQEVAGELAAKDKQIAGLKTERDEFRSRLKLERAILADANRDLAELRQRIAELEARPEQQPVAFTEECEITNMQATGLYLRGFPTNAQGRDIPLYTAAQAAQPLPIAPTMEQLIAGKRQLTSSGKMSRLMSQRLSDVYRAMISAAPAAQPVTVKLPEPWRSFVTDDDIAALIRFADCCDDPDSGCHDLEPEQVARLVSIGALNQVRKNYHETTHFGDFLISAGITIAEGGGAMSDTLLEYACQRIVELEALLLVDVPETVWPAEVEMVYSQVQLAYSAEALLFFEK